MKGFRMDSGQREFLRLVSQAVLTNPFSDERVAVDLAITGLSADTPSDKRVDAVTTKVTAFLEALDASSRLDLDSAGRAEDRELLRYAFLFEVFHRFVEPFDKHILEQIVAEDSLCPLRFADDALAQLRNRGFDRHEAVRFFAMFYQLRRAYYFIDRSLVGRSACMKGLRRALWDNVFTRDIRWYEKHLWNRMEDFSTLLLGETGTGKGAAASAIGRSGFIPFDERKGCFAESFMRSFVAINLSQYPETLIESELFGHRKGAFTGAVEAHEGVLARCSPHGSIFLDEVGDVGAPIQVKLLQVLEERSFCPVGSHQRQRFNGRIIAATNRPMDKLRRGNQFRDDFFYRLCSDVIVMPPLRQRVGEEESELNELVAHTLMRIAGHESTELQGLVRDAIRRDLGSDYTWPGNVRELEQCVRRILLTHRYEGDRAAISSDLRDVLTAGIDAGSYNAQDLLADYCGLLYERHGTYEEVARRTGLDRRTARKYILGRGAG